MNRVEAARQRRCEKETNQKKLEVHEVTNDEIIRDFDDAAALNGLTWKEAVFAVGGEYGLIDVDGNPKDRWAAKVLSSAKKAHRRGREFYLHEVRLKRSWMIGQSGPEGQPVATSPRPALYRVRW